MPEDDITEAIRLAHILINKLDAIGTQIDEIRAILRSEVIVQTVDMEMAELQVKGKSN